MNITVDHHVHSAYSACCGENYDLMDIITAQKKRGIEYACVTDHVHSSKDTAGIEEHHRRLEKYAEETGSSEAEYNVYIGAEVTFTSLRGDLPLNPENLKYPPAFIIGGCHYIPWQTSITMGDIPGSIQELSFMTNRGIDTLIARHKNMIFEAVSRGDIDILAHPFDIFFRFGFFHKGFLSSFPEILNACAATNTAVEINNVSARRCMESIPGGTYSPGEILAPADFFTDMLKITAESEVQISPGSDAHSLDAVGDLNAVATAFRIAGISPERLLRLDRKPAVS